jgi:DNA-directed RNA polymerase specialized sigma24 family protein
MSAALQLPMIWGAGSLQGTWQDFGRKEKPRPAAKQDTHAVARAPAEEPVVSLAFYRKHTEKMLRRYLYASMQVGRAPSILGDPVARGWVSSRPVRTFEDAVIFVLDMETCLTKIGALERQLLSRIVLQEYTQSETAALLGMSVRTICYKFPQALDSLTEKLLDAGLLVLPH